MNKLIEKVLGRIFPQPENGNACHEAAFDPEQMPEAMREKLEQANAKETAAKSANENKG